MSDSTIPQRRVTTEAAVRGTGFVGQTLSDRFVIVEWDGGNRAALIVAPAGQAAVDFHRYMTDALGSGDAQKWPGRFCQIITIDGALAAIGHESSTEHWFFLTDIEGVRYVHIS